jgi:type IV pilus assembly protein PilM
MAQRILGLDIGAWSVKATVVESSLRKTSVVAFREHHLPVDAAGAPLPDGLRPAVQALLAGLEYDTVASAVPGAQVLTRELELPFSDPKRIAQVLPFQLENLIPRPLDQLSHDYQVVGRKDAGVQLLCAAIDRSHLRDFIERARSAGVDPRTVTLAAAAVENVAPHLLPAAAPGSSGGPRADVLIDLGHRATTATVVRDGRLVAFRTIARGGFHLTQALARDLGLAFPDAEAWKHKSVTADPDALEGETDERALKASESVQRALAPLLRDLRVSLDALASRVGVPIRAATLIGGGAALEGLPEALSDALGITAERARASDSLWAPDIASNPAATLSGALAAALALEPLEADDAHRINLRTGEFSYGSDFEALKAKAGWIAAFVGVLLTLHFVRQAVLVDTLEDQEAQLGEKLEAHMAFMLGEPGFAADKEEIRERFRLATELIDAPPADETRDLYPGMTAFNAFYTSTRVQHEVNEGLLPDDMFDDDGVAQPGTQPIVELKQLELQAFNTDGKNMTITGTAFDIDVIEAYKSKLAEVPCFKAVERQDTKATSNRDRPNWRDFTLKAELKCAPVASDRTAGSGAGSGKPAEEKP